MNGTRRFLCAGCYTVHMKWPVLLIGVVLVVGVITFAISYGVPEDMPVATSTAEIIPNVASETYEDTTHRFSMDHPATSAVLATGFEAYLPVTAQPVVAFTLPTELFQGTNLVEAGVYVGVLDGAKTVNACLVPHESEESKGTIKIGPIIFSVFTSGGAAAGNIYEQTTYRTVRNGNCYELVALLHSGNIGNYPDGQVQQFDREKFQTILDKMLQTFTLTGKAGSGVEGTVLMRCSKEATGTECATKQILTIGVYQGISAVGLFKTNEDGTFRSELPPGHYELRIHTATTTRCASVGIVIPNDEFISTNISCEIGAVQ